MPLNHQSNGEIITILDLMNTCGILGVQNSEQQIFPQEEIQNNKANVSQSRSYGVSEILERQNKRHGLLNIQKQVPVTVMDITSKYGKAIYPVNFNKLSLLINYGNMHPHYETKSLEYFKVNPMANLRKRVELNKLPSIKDQNVRNWINSNEFFQEIVGDINTEIEVSTKEFDIQIRDIYIKDAYVSDVGDLEEFVITVIVPKGSDVAKINEFWDFITSKATELIDMNQENDLCGELEEKLLIVVKEEE